VKYREARAAEYVKFCRQAFEAMSRTATYHTTVRWTGEHRGHLVMGNGPEMKVRRLRPMRRVIRTSSRPKMPLLPPQIPVSC